MAEQNLDHPDVGPAVQRVCGKAVPQRIQTGRCRNASPALRSGQYIGQCVKRYSPLKSWATREEHEDARDVARAIRKTPQYKVSSKFRKKVEMLFAHLKRILGLGWLRLRSPCGANDEFLLAATAQNLRNLAKIFPAPQQTRVA